MKDADEFFKTCDVCQSTNGAKFMKTAAPLHLIPTQPSVWHQVSCNQDYLKLIHARINLGWNRPDWSPPKN